MAERNPPTKSATAVLDAFVEAARTAFGADLVSVVLFGSGAEDRLRPTSDLNVIVVLARFDVAKADVLREQARFANAAVRLMPMFVLASELPAAAEAFAVKFADISRRHRLLHGSDPFADLEISREAGIRRLRQVLLNLVLRMRQRYVLTSLRHEQMVMALADFAGPLRAAAAALLELSDGRALPPREALQHWVRELGREDAETVLSRVSAAREFGSLPAGEAASTFLALIEITAALERRAQELG